MAKTICCPICGRPYTKPNTPCYNIPNVGVVCVDCYDKHSKVFGKKTPPTTSEKIKALQERINYTTPYTCEVTYKAKNLSPFDIFIRTSKNHGVEIAVPTIRDLVTIKDAIDKYLESVSV